MIEFYGIIKLQNLSEKQVIDDWPTALYCSYLNTALLPKTDVPYNKFRCYSSSQAIAVQLKNLKKIPFLLVASAVQKIERKN